MVIGELMVVGELIVVGELKDLARDENGAGVAGVEGRDNNKKGRIAAIGGRSAQGQDFAVACRPVL